METITVLIGHLPQRVWVSGCRIYRDISFPQCSQKAAIVMGNYRPVHKVAHPIWRDRPLQLAQPAGSSENMSLLHRAPQMLFNFQIQVVPFGCCLVFSLVCVLLKLPFPKLIFRMEFGRANRAPVGRVHLPCREGYEKRQDNRFHQQVQGGEKRTITHSHKHLEMLLRTAWVLQAFSIFQPKTPVLFFTVCSVSGKVSSAFF